MVCLFPSQGRDIQVVIPTTYKATYDKILEENATYTLCNFQVVSNDLVFKASEHKFLLKWTGGTTAEDINVHDVPQSDTKFKPFAEIISGKWKPDILVSEFIVVYNKLLLFILFYLFVSKNLALFFFFQDAIEVVQKMGFCQLNQGTGKKLQVNFTMKDLR